MINPEDEIIVDFRTSCTKEEAVAKLLGWMQGPIHLKFIQAKHGITADQLPHLHSLIFSLEEHLMALRETARHELLDAAEVGAAAEVIWEKDDAVAECDALIQKAYSYKLDIEKELAKGESSALKIDQPETDRTSVIHLTLESLDEWAKKYDIAIIDAPESLTANTPEPQRQPPVGIEADMDKMKKQDKQPKLRTQEKTIMDEITNLGYDPKCLPKNETGKPGVKATVKHALKQNLLFKGSRVFDKAWERLRGDGDIANLK